MFVSKYQLGDIEERDVQLFRRLCIKGIVDSQHSLLKEHLLVLIQDERLLQMIINQCLDVINGVIILFMQFHKLILYYYTMTK